MEEQYSCFDTAALFFSNVKSNRNKKVLSLDCNLWSFMLHFS